VEWIDPAEYEELLAGGREAVTPAEAEYYSAIARFIAAAQRYRYYAPAKDAELENYHSAMEEYDAAWRALDGAAEAVKRRVG
jgi:hypothetical protein